MKTKYILITAYLLCFMAINRTNSQGFVNAKYSGDFLSTGVGGRSAAMGGTGVSFSDDVTSGYFNPAALSQIKFAQLAILHESRFSGQINYDYAAIAYPYNETQTFAISALRLGLDGIKDSRNALIDANGNGKLDDEDRLDPAKITLSNASNWGIFFSYSKKQSNEFSYGANLKLMYKSIIEHNAYGVGFDLSVMYEPTENLKLGANLQDATKSLLTWSTGAQEFIVPTLKLGSSYKYNITDKHSVMPAIDVNMRFEGSDKTAQVGLGFASLDFATGLEYSYNGKAFARAGFTENKQLTFGAGFKLPKLNIDYAFTKENEDLSGFGATHRISLRLTLEEDKFAR